MSSRLIAICALLASAAAFAQVEKPTGIKIGDGRRHPSFDLERPSDTAADRIEKTTHVLNRTIVGGVLIG